MNFMVDFYLRIDLKLAHLCLISKKYVDLGNVDCYGCDKKVIMPQLILLKKTALKGLIMVRLGMIVTLRSYTMMMSLSLLLVI